MATVRGRGPLMVTSFLNMVRDVEAAERSQAWPDECRSGRHKAGTGTSSKNDLGFVVIKEYQMSRLDEDDEDPLLATRLLMAAYRMRES